jgi:hypothetical protein
LEVRLVRDDGRALLVKEIYLYPLTKNFRGALAGDADRFTE